MNRRVGLTSFFALAFSTVAFATQMTYGKYFGSIQMDDSHQKIAVSLDAFIVQKSLSPNDPTQFPQLEIIVRPNLQGYFSSEYLAYDFYDPTYNFEQGILELSDSNSDLAATVTVTNSDSVTILDGPVVFRPTQKQGHMHVEMQVDNVHVRNQPVDQSVPFLSKLGGEYFGKCGRYNADLQIETGRGLAHAAGSMSGVSALDDYAVTGRLGYEDETMCPSAASGFPTPLYCVMHTFSSGIYYLFDNRVTLQGPRASMDCTRDGDTLNCIHQSLSGKVTCSLTKQSPAATPPVQFLRQFYLNPTADQKKSLPDPLPPSNVSLIAALNGNFYGFLHHENRDQYQLIQMNVVAATSTENPHNQNVVTITPTVAALLGASWNSTSMISTPYSQRVFYINPGFMVEGPDADSFLVVEDWKQGYLRGEWYSRSFGRVGTFEFQKTVRPAVPSTISLVSSFDGLFQGPTDADIGRNYAWRMQMTVPAQTAQNHEGVVSFLGSFQMKGGITVAETFGGAAFDMYTNSISFLTSDPDGIRLLVGNVSSDSQMRIIWPAAPLAGAPMWAYDLYTYVRVPTHSQGEH